MYLNVSLYFIGKKTGFVTTSRITHATPAPLYAATPERMWEDDSTLPQQAKDDGCKDIAEQLLGPTGSKLNVSSLNFRCLSASIGSILVQYKCDDEYYYFC